MTRNEQPSEGTTQTSTRNERIYSALEGWRKHLVSKNGRNPLFKFRELQRGTINLDRANPDSLNALLSGRAIAIKTLFKDSDPNEISSLEKNASTVFKKAKENQEERGISTMRMVSGLVVGETSAGKELNAPLLIQDINIKPTDNSHQTFVATLDASAGSIELNPVLLHALSDEGIVFDPSQIQDFLSVTSSAHNLSAEIWNHMRSSNSSINRYRLIPGSYIGNFSYAKFPMVEDLKKLSSLALNNNIVAALAGDPEAMSVARGVGVDPSPQAPDLVAPENEFLILDADSSQNYVINAVLNGKSLVVQGPPGTGKSQTIANLIATLAAQNKSVLFVAEKSAAIDAVVKRLDNNSLGHLVLDLHNPSSTRSHVRKQLEESLRESKNTVSATKELGPLAQQRKMIIGRENALHKNRHPWDLSAYEAMTQHFEDRKRTKRLGQLELPELNNLEKYTETARSEIASTIRQLVGLDAFSSDFKNSGWIRASINDEQDVLKAITLTRNICTDKLDRFRSGMENIFGVTHLPTPISFEHFNNTFNLLDDTQRCMEQLGPEIFSEDLYALTAACASKAWRNENGQDSSWLERRKLRRFARGLSTSGAKGKELFEELEFCLDTRNRWLEAEPASEPVVPEDWMEIRSLFLEISDDLEEINKLSQGDVNSDMTIDELQESVHRLSEASSYVSAIPEIRRFEMKLEYFDLGSSIPMLEGTDPTASEAEALVSLIIMDNLVGTWKIVDRDLAPRTSLGLDQSTKEFKQLDNQHIRNTPGRVARRSAENLIKHREKFHAQDSLLQKELAKKRRLLTTRELVDQAPELIMALKPCWAMSPLMVSQVLPQRQMFDVIIFDEASQVSPYDAIPSILRGKQVVVAGDSKQLPPTRFFESDDINEDEDEAVDTDAFESLLDAMSGFLTQRYLEWHYRSQDERLIAVSNRQIYGGSLVTFPGSNSDNCLTFIQAPTETNEVMMDSSSSEVTAVLGAILEHFQERPEESLGIITPGVKHAERIETSMRFYASEYPELQLALSDDLDEPVFVKNIERVQGDERDAIIISTGYCRRNNGQLVQNFGPINQQGGERRLNVAASRARKRMTLVSSFNHQDLDPTTENRGRKILRDLFEFIETGGERMGPSHYGEVDQNPFEVEIFDSLTKAGLDVVPQLGVSNYRIDFAIRHPKQPGRFVLAVEADGAQYHSSPTARDRDRLRQEHLERLGWKFHRIWSTNWFADPALETTRVVNAYEAALRVPAKTPLTGPGHKTRVRRLNDSNHVPATKSSPKPEIFPGRPINEYSNEQLESLAKWVRSDGVLRTCEEGIREMQGALGYRQMGARIRTRLTSAWEATN